MERGTARSRKGADKEMPRGEAGKGTLHGSAIEDYAVIGDCETAALVSREGSIDWLCWPAFSSPACFAALLGTCDHGFWKIAPAAKIKDSRRRYREGTLIVETVFEAATGEVCVTDFMPQRGKHSQLVRMVRGERGNVRMRMDLAVRFDYGRTVPWVTSKKKEWRAVAGSDMVVLHTDALLHGEDHTTSSDFTVRKGETVTFTLTYCSSLEKIPEEISSSRALKETQKFWTRWLGRNTYRGPYKAAVSRSLMTLKALSYAPTGGIVAAVTTSLPERIGGGRNWDYRLCWLRDTAFTLLVLLRAGYREEAVEWRQWLLRAAAGSPDQLQTIYGLSGERNVIEWEADWLPGYENSRPVRIGNGAAGQFQLDVYGEVASALARMPDAEDDDVRVSALSLQTALANHLCDVWHLPDEGIWEVRGGAKHFVHSKVMAWVALDRAIQMVEQSRGKAGRAGRRQSEDEIKLWKKVRAQIHREVCRKGFDKKLNSFVQSYGAKTLDASCLRIALVGFLPASDPRILGTIEAIEKKLMKDGLVLRYNTRNSGDGLTGGEGQFLACSFWMVINLWLVGRKNDAKALFDRLLALRNDVGLLAEEYDTRRKRMVGNFPQALSHIALVHAAFALSGEWSPPHSHDEESKGTAWKDEPSGQKRRPRTGATKAAPKRS